jgi:hypothetical protein
VSERQVPRAKTKCARGRSHEHMTFPHASIHDARASRSQQQLIERIAVSLQHFFFLLNCDSLPLSFFAQVLFTDLNPEYEHLIPANIRFQLTQKKLISKNPTGVKTENSYTYYKHSKCSPQHAKHNPATNPSPQLGSRKRSNQERNQEIWTFRSHRPRSSCRTPLA